MSDRPWLRYLVVGLANTAVGYGLILVLQSQAGVHPVLANAAGYAVGLLISYALNRSFTFGSRRSHFSGAPVFAAAAAACYLLNVAVLQLSLTLLQLPPALAQALALCTYTLAFYVANRYVVFRNHGS